MLSNHKLSLMNKVHQKIIKLINGNPTISQESNSIIYKLIISKLKPNYTRSQLLEAILNEFYSAEDTKLKYDIIIDFCVIIELLNIANQIHDFIDDCRTLNKFKTFINKKYFTLEQTVLIGDLIFTLAFEEMTKINDLIVFNHFANTTEQMALAEAKLLEFKSSNYPKIDSQTILKLTEAKHSPLFHSIMFIIDRLDKNQSLENKTAIENKIFNAIQQYTKNKVQYTKVHLTNTAK